LRQRAGSALSPAPQQHSSITASTAHRNTIKNEGLVKESAEVSALKTATGMRR
jgi:hypothetical protein